MRSKWSLQSKPFRWALALFFVISTLFSVSIPVSADMGPKPSVSVSIRGIPDEETYFATLLSKEPGSGPQRVYSIDDPSSSRYYGDDWDMWQKFVDYSDPDGFHYLQQHWKLQGNDSFEWGYYPPDTFKVLLYFPEYDSFVVSEITERFTFESSFRISVAGTEYRTNGTTSIVKAETASGIVSMLLDAVIRVVLTLLIELLIALAFNYREKKQLIFILVVNIITQLLMNAVLLFFRYHAGFFISALFYVLMEFVIFFVEAVLYAIFLKPLSTYPISRGVTVLYAFVANFLSCVVGLVSVIIYSALI